MWLMEFSFTLGVTGLLEKCLKLGLLVQLGGIGLSLRKAGQAGEPRAALGRRSGMSWRL